MVVHQVDTTGAEYQEQFGLLFRPENYDMFQQICGWDTVITSVLGSIDRSGRVMLWDEKEQSAVVDLKFGRSSRGIATGDFHGSWKSIP